MNKLVTLTVVLWLGVWLVACNLDQMPDATPTASVLLPSATPTNTPPLTDSPTPTAEPTASPTAEPEPTATVLEPTLEPTATIEPTETTPSEPIQISLDIYQPAADDEVTVGSQLVIRGQAQPANDNNLSLRLEVVSRTIFTGTVSVDDPSGTWTTTITVPHNVTGPGQLIVSAPSGETAVVPLRLLPDPNLPGLTLRRPGPGDPAVAGYTLFFEGRALEPINDTVRIGVMIDDCTIAVVVQDITVSGGPWRGLLNLPPDITGPACAVAFTGSGSFSAPEGEWREARLPITILSSAEPEALGISLGNPSGTTFQAGQTAELFGVAVNALNNEVYVAVMLDDGQGMILAEGITTVDAFGFWEIDLPLPADRTGPAVILVTIGQGDSRYEIRVPTTVTP